ncbi:fatty acyl-AMP ligase [Streptomyces mirabilis]|uniref:fatty acyl-AMP ligase n=1 Tax=Streptomyces mirabilis TaxID=68239 RepID=UPI003438BEAC
MASGCTVHPSVGEAFLERVAAHPERPALTIYRGSAATRHESLTFAELARRAGLRAADLGARLTPGERVLIALPTSTEFVELYLACMFAGLIAVPAPVLGGSPAATARVAAVVRDCTPGLAVTTPADRTALADRLRELGQGHVLVEEPGVVGPGAAPAGIIRGRRPDQETVTVLQYSSGSTGTPKGVMLAHGDIRADIEYFGVACGLGPDDSFGSWIPLHHDMGLFLQLSAALVLGAPSVLMQPGDFVRRPVEWFRMMSRYGTTVTAAPSFAYGLCLRLIPDDLLVGIDLSRLRFAAIGAEPIHVPAMTEFTKRFACTGLRPGVVSPGYGLAEATVYVAATPPGELPNVLVVDPHRLESAHRPELVPASGGEGKEVVGVGRPVGVRARIVDPETRRALPDGAIGEIWLRGPSVGRGYWGRPELSAEVFAARLADDGADDGADDSAAGAGRGWLRTGDLGALRDGELFITGRIKELLIVRGRNIFPYDLEHEARAAHQALAKFNGAAFGVSAPDERIVLMHEVDPRLPAEELPGVASAVSRRLTRSVGFPIRNILLVRRGAVPRTTSGKIQRGAARLRFLSGDLTPVYAELEPEVRAVAGDTDVRS